MLQVDSVLQKRKNVLVMYEKDTNTASKCLFFFRAVKIRYGFSGGCPFIGLTTFVLRWLLDVDIHTYYALYGLQNAFTLLDGFHAVLLHEKKTDSLLSVPLRCLCLRRSVSLCKNKEMLGC